ncbi:DNA primase family protein [Carnobacterium funditum]|uniref:DNA primase family protein n=1 Tax=Carnobacterium funditum TaxID=2752 RepID=UPI00068A3093|nr:DNA primase family protein [Carnobacterium funditum]
MKEEEEDLFKDIANDVENMKKTKKKKEVKKTPKTPEDLKNLLIDLGDKGRESKEYTVGKGENAETKYPRLMPLEVAYVLNDIFFFCLFNMEEGTRLAIYMRFEGIYTQNETMIKRYISYVEPTFTERQAEDVIYKIANISEVKEKTNSRYLIPVNNGVFNLETKKLEKFTSDYVFTSKIATDYNDKATLPIFEGWNVEQWLKDLSNGEEDLNTLLWQVISSAMNGNFSRKKSIWLYGEGNTGKGTFQELITNMVGRNNIATLKVNQFSERFALPLLEGKTCVIGDDVPAHVYIDDSSNFNSTVTGDPVRIEQKNKAAYSTVFNMTVIQSTNGLPRVHNTTEGTYKRFLIVQFKQAFKGEGDNWSIKNDYIKRKDVLEYVLQKAINIDFEKFILPASSEQLMNQYKIDNDPIRDFKVSVFDQFTSTRIPLYLLYQYYLDFCEENKYKYMTSRNFINSLERVLDTDWEKKKSKVGNFFNEKYLPLQMEKNTKIEAPEKDKTYACLVNTRIELAS